MAADPSTPSSQPSAGVGSSDPRRTLVLMKQGHRHVFHYRQGDEQAMLRELQNLASDSQSVITPFDAAVLARQIAGDMLRPAPTSTST